MTIHSLPPRPSYWTEEDDLDGVVYVALWANRLYKADSLSLLWSAITSHHSPNQPSQLQARAA